MADLIKMVPQELLRKLDGLTPAEQKLLNEAGTDEFIDFQVNDNDIDKPENGENWGPDRTIRAALLEWLLMSKEANQHLEPRGVTIVGARIDERIDLDDCKMPFQFGLMACYLPGGLSLNRATVTALNFVGSHFSSFFLQGAVVKGSLFLSGVHATDEVKLLDIFVGGSLVCMGAHFGCLDEKNPAFNADRAIVKGGLFLRGMVAKGEVRLLGVEVGGQLDCDGAHFERIGKKRPALNAEGAVVRGDLFLREVGAKGEVRLTGVDVGDQLNCDGARLENSGECALHLQDAKLGGSLFLRGLKAFVGQLFLGGARVKYVVDEEESWPSENQLYLNNFEYDGFEGTETTPLDAKSRLEWLGLQEERPFYPQPYTQLAKVYRKMGRDADARKVLLERERRRRKYGEMSRLGRWWSCIVDAFVGYGYQYLKPVIWALSFYVIGVGVFSGASYFEVMQPVHKGYTVTSSDLTATIATAKPDSTGTIPFYPQFNSFIYSLETFVPFLDMKQQAYWQPAPTRSINIMSVRVPFGCLVRFWWWVEIVFGWFLTTLVVAALTGIMQREK